jgi:hypothetical protein
LGEPLLAGNFDALEICVLGSLSLLVNRMINIQIRPECCLLEPGQCPLCETAWLSLSLSNKPLPLNAQHGLEQASGTSIGIRRILSHFVAFLAYCLPVTLKQIKRELFITPLLSMD